MNNRKFLIVTMREDYISKRKEYRSSIDKNLIRWIQKIGYDPLLISVNKNLNLKLIFGKIKIKGIIISGGNEINRKSDRYAIEKKILKYSIKFKLPVLGICHGMQMMSDIEGGDLKRTKHEINKFYYLLNKSDKYAFPKKVKCYHNYTIKRLSKNFDVLCTCKNGSIEAISHKKFKWLGWMFHPEREKNFDKKLLKTIKKFFK